MKARILAAAATVAAAALISACGSDNGGGGGSSAGGGYGGSSGSGTASASKGAARISLRSTGVGKVLVDGQGRTLYLFEKDSGGKSACNGECASDWPPLTTAGKAAAGSGVSSGMLATTRRSDGKLQVVYNGHPLYRYAGDNKAGDTRGNGIDEFGAEWYALDASGAKVQERSKGGGSDSRSTY